jgi:hypothetical protein
MAKWRIRQYNAKPIPRPAKVLVSTKVRAAMMLSGICYVQVDGRSEKIGFESLGGGVYECKFQDPRRFYPAEWI